MWVCVHARAKYPRSKPLGHRAIGVRMVSCVGVIDALASHRRGPSPKMSRKTSVRP
jgi:hypothetical protein